MAGFFFVVPVSLAHGSGILWGIASHLPGTQYVYEGLEKCEREGEKSELMFQRQAYRTPAVLGEWQITLGCDVGLSSDVDFIF